MLTSTTEDRTRKKKKFSFHLTAALASASLAFFRRALQMSRSSRRFSRRRLSFCRRQEGTGGCFYDEATSSSRKTVKYSVSMAMHCSSIVSCWNPTQRLKVASESVDEPVKSLTDIVRQSPSRKLRRGVRKPTAEAWRRSRSAPPSLFWYSPTVIRVLPTNTHMWHVV